MRDLELRNLCRKLRPILGVRADALWNPYATAETPQSKLESEALIQMLAIQFLSGSVQEEPILLPPPSREAAFGEFFLGMIQYGRKALYPLLLRRENFIKHLGIFSITGGGKTNVAQVLLLGLLEKMIPFLVIDWKRSYRALRTLHHPQAKSINVYSVGRKTASPLNWNPLRAPPSVAGPPASTSCASTGSACSGRITFRPRPPG